MVVDVSGIYDRILLSTDGSEQSVRATDHALEIARQFGSDIHAIHVVDDRGSGRAAERLPERQVMEERREEAGNGLTAAVTERAREAGLDARRGAVRRTGRPDHGVLPMTFERATLL